MSVVDKFVNFFKISEVEKEILTHDIKEENIRRTFYLSLLAIPNSLLHVILFASHLPDSIGIEYKWRLSILITHSFIALLLLVVCLTVYFSFIRTKRNIGLANICVILLIIMLLFVGALISSLDQLVTNAINPFIATSLIYAIVLLVRPLYSVIYYLSSFLVFYFFMSYMQPNPEILTSNNVNGLTFTGLGICLSFIFWKMYLTRMKQHKLIEEQKNEITENFNKLKFYSEELKESNTTKDKLISIIAHDLRSPLASLINVTKLLSEDFEIMTKEEAKNVLILLNTETELTYESLNNLLVWSRTQQKKFVPISKVLNLNKLVESTLQAIKSIYQQKNIEISKHISDKIEVYADYSMVQSILKNLLINSVKFTSQGGRISIGASVNENTVTILIEDNGVGIKREKLEKLFISGMEFTTQGTQNEKGTGLGLQICKEFVELNGGRIWAESEVGKGSKFYFTLPLSK